MFMKPVQFDRLFHFSFEVSLCNGLKKFRRNIAKETLPKTVYNHASFCLINLCIKDG